MIHFYSCIFLMHGQDFKTLPVHLTNGHGPPWFFTRACPQKRMKETQWLSQVL